MASSDQSLPAVAAESKFYEIPALRVNHFVGRKYLLDRIHKCCQEGALVVVLIGMGGKAPGSELEPTQYCNWYIPGQGKTQLSLEYCRAERTERTENSVFWVDATSMGTVNRSFEGIALELAPGSKFSNSEAARTFVLKKLEVLTDPVLMIFDNYRVPHHSRLSPASFQDHLQQSPYRCEEIRYGYRDWRYDCRGEHASERLFPSEVLFNCR